ncbi:DNA/RNA non-specific endonuclease [uncultured Azohydromonas sp.]|jgi:DNA/RNA endonuclease G, NUC1|uniref:DNA/RNA non-specific endonuclease n=1 Tax=uncultured Azohydromonas sp. TaxID=487342 RepID=UPI002625AC30|nr:DNA/RNA non-specific endonuclease [uncultured Azohydromonas sp.]
MKTNLLAAALLAAVALSACDTRTTQPKTPGPASAPPVAAAPKAEPVTGFKECRKFFPGELPRVPDLQARMPRDLCYDAFAVLHSGRTKTPVFVVEKLTAAQLADAADEERTNKFFADARLPQGERATLEDYKGSGYDRGHMAPAADMPTPTAMAQSFSLANMVPQSPQNNRGPWADLENATRQYVRRAKGPVFVFTGPVYSSAGAQVIGKGRVWVPKQLYKLVYDAGSNRAWAHWLENENEARAGKPISYPELVRRTGIEFLPGLAPNE